MRELCWSQLGVRGGLSVTALFPGQLPASGVLLSGADRRASRDMQSLLRPRMGADPSASHLRLLAKQVIGPKPRGREAGPAHSGRAPQPPGNGTDRRKKEWRPRMENASASHLSGGRSSSPPPLRLGSPRARAGGSGRVHKSFQLPLDFFKPTKRWLAFSQGRGPPLHIQAAR